MAGMVDDFKDALKELLRAAHLPISIQVVKMGKSNQENDSEKFRSKAMPAFEESERVFINLMDFENYKENEVHTPFFQEQLSYDLMKGVPQQIEKYFEM